uniref:Uncharacterized protein n=1 Tax=Anguilla anguilla TaxID=7936 RepID=A0A0E9SZS2_ANGAN
MCLGACLSD